MKVVPKKNAATTSAASACQRGVVTVLSSTPSCGGSGTAASDTAPHIKYSRGDWQCC
jgi:hypothetical protein